VPSAIVDRGAGPAGSASGAPPSPGDVRAVWRS
jgi:hypothetical protein